jgi:hypothetical protein
MFINYIAVLLKEIFYLYFEENYKTFINEYYAASMQYFSF